MSEVGFRLRMKAFWLDAHLQTHDKMRTLRETIAMRNGSTYTNEDHEKVRQRYKDQLTELRNDPMFND